MFIPDPITPEQLDAWREQLGIGKGDACAMIGKGESFWSKFLSGETEMKLSDLNILLTKFTIRRLALGL